jgi:class 3 adenylate cyclase
MLAPILGAAMVCTAIAVGLLLLARIDKAEAIRLRVLVFATPFLLAGLVIKESWVPFSLSIGLLIYLFGSIRYLMLQSRRGQFMSQFLSPQVTRLVQHEGMDRVLERQQRIISIVVCDLRNFTAFAGERDSETVVDILERYYEIVGEVAIAHDATVKDQAGDGVLILVGAPLPVKNPAQRACRLALELMRRWQERRATLSPSLGPGLGPDLGLGIGVATGPVTVGAIHGASRLEYVAVGNAVNLAARLCSRAEDGDILIDEETWSSLKPRDATQATARAPESLKGFADPVAVYALAASALPATT